MRIDPQPDYKIPKEEPLSPEYYQLFRAIMILLGRMK